MSRQLKCVQQNKKEKKRQDKKRIIDTTRNMEAP